MKEIVECVFRNTIYTCLCKWAKMKEISSQNVHKFLNQLKYWMVSNNYYATLSMDSCKDMCVCVCVLECKSVQTEGNEFPPKIRNFHLIDTSSKTRADK